MAAAETAKLIASLELKDLFTKQVDNATKSLGKLDKSIDSSQGRAYKAGQQIGTGIKRGALIAVGAIGLIATQVALGAKSLEDLEVVTAQTNAVLKSTKDASGQTAKGIRDMANAFENMNATMDDTAIQAGANVLLTFTNIREKAFKPALQAALDLSAGMHQDLQSSVVQLGKALNDPVKGITALTRVGVTFTDQQKNQIKILERGGKTFQAQKIILAEINKEFGGSFLAQGNTTAGKIAKVKDAIDDLQRALATALLPVLAKVADATSKFLTDPKVVKSISDFGQQIAAMFSDENIAQGGKILVSLFDSAKAAAPVIQKTAEATLTLVKTAVSLFSSLPDWVQQIAVAGFAVNKLTGGLVTNIAGGLADIALKSRGATPANPLFVSDVTGGLGGAAAGAAGAAEGGLLGQLKGALKFLPVLGLGLIAGDIQNQNADQNIIGPAIQKAFKDGQLSPDQIRDAVKEGFLDASALQAAAPPAKQLAPTLLDRGGREKGRDNFITVGGFDKRIVSALVSGFGKMLTALRDAKSAKAIEAAVKEAVHQVIGLSKGNASNTKATAAGLRDALKHTTDPKIRRDIVAALAKVQAKIPGREYAQKQISKADALIRDGKVTRSDLKTIQKIENDLKNRGLPHAAAVIQAKIDQDKNATVSAVHGTTAAIQAQKTAITIQNAVSVSLRSLFNGQSIQNSFTRTTRNTNTIS